MILSDLLQFVGLQSFTVYQYWNDKRGEYEKTFDAYSESETGLKWQIEQIRAEVGLCDVATILVQNNRLVIVLKD